MCCTLWGCDEDDTPEVKQRVDEKPRVEESPVPDRSVTVSSSGANTPVRVHFKFHDITPLYQSFLLNTEAVGALGADLGECLRKGVNLLAAWDLEKRQGRLTLILTPGASKCLPSLEGDMLDLAPIIPITTALANYRDTLASSYDLRISFFRLGLQYTRGADTCLITPQGDHPPSGNIFSSCLGFGSSLCASEKEPGVRFSFPTRADQEVIGHCFKE